MNPFFQPWNILYEYMMDHDPDAKRMTPTQRRNCAAFIVQWVEHCVEDYRDIAGERLPSSVAADHHISILSCKENNIQSALLYAVIDVDRREITLFQTSIREFWNEVRQNSVTEWAFMDVEELFIGHELYHFFECSKWGFAYQESPVTLPHPFFRWKKIKPKLVTELAAQLFTQHLYKGGFFV